MRTHRALVLAVLAAIVAFSLTSHPGSASGGGGCPAAPVDLYSDFDGDGFADVGVGVYGEDISDVNDAGGVNAIYGTPSGLSATDDQFWSQDSPKVDDDPEDSDYFGRFVASGDFNGDGLADLSIGAYGEVFDDQEEAGAVHVLYGDATGGLAARSGSTHDFLHQGALSVGDGNEAGDRFGIALAAGDFNGDGYDDLAVGADQEDVDPGGGPVLDAGAVYVLAGSPRGLTARAQFWYQGKDGVLSDAAEDGDAFGRALVAGDFDGDQIDDLAIGAEFEDLEPGRPRAGAVNVLYGSSPGGLTGTRDQFWTQDNADAGDAAEAGDFLGRDLAVGDFNADDHDDLAIGAKGETLDSERGAGAVNVLFGGPDGLTDLGSQFLRQGTSPLTDGPEEGDHFGRALASGDFDGDADDDLAIGVYSEDVDATPDAGALHVLEGDPTSPLSSEAFVWTESAVGGGVQQEDEFAKGLDAADYNGDGCGDLIVGIYHQVVTGHTWAGGAFVVYGSEGTGLAEATAQFWSQNSPGIEENPEDRDRFGWQFG